MSRLFQKKVISLHRYFQTIMYIEDKILDYLQVHPSSSREDIYWGIHFTKSDATIKRILAKLVQEGRISVSGKARATRYSCVSSNEPIMKSTNDSIFPYKVLSLIISFLFVLGVAGGIMYKIISKQDSSSSLQTALTCPGEKMIVMLSDGSRIHLNSDSRIIFPERFSKKERRIRLEGEAYFDVAKKEHCPFIVETQESSIKVLGTRFNAYSFSGEPVKVALEEGSVQFNFHGKQVQLAPGEMITYNPLTKRGVLTRTADIRTEKAWTSNRIEWKNLPMEAVIRNLKRMYGVDVYVASPNAYNYSFTISMKDGGILPVLKRMENVSPLHIHYSEENQRVTIQ